MEDIIQLSDITIVATLADTVLLCVNNEDKTNPESLAIQYDLGMGTFHIDNIQKFLKFTAFEPVEIENEHIQDYYRDFIYRKLPNNVYVNSLIKFTGEEITDELQKAYISGLVDESVIEKAWQKHAVGSVVTRKDGKKYRKVSESGDSSKDWISEDKMNKPEEKNLSDKKSEEDSKHGEKNEEKPSGRKLKNFAKKTSVSSLKSTVENSSDPDLRKIANEELDRREKEEKPENKKVDKQIKKGFESWL